MEIELKSEIMMKGVITLTKEEVSEKDRLNTYLHKKFNLNNTVVVIEKE